MAALDCRTRAYEQRSTRFGSASTTQSYRQSSARIFEHCRSSLKESQGLVEGRTSTIRYPSSFADIEQWLGDIVESALRRTGEGVSQYSSVKLLFVDEKRWVRSYKTEFDLDKLHSCLKVSDWATAHYMSTFCRFPLPLDTDADENRQQRNYNWGWRYSISHPFNWDMLWAYFPSTGTSVGIVRTWFEDYETNFLELESLTTNFKGPTLSHPMLLGLFTLQILTHDAMANVREKGNHLYEAQRRTGFHVYDRLRSTDIYDEVHTSDLAAITKDILGAASNMTGWENASKQLVRFANFIIKENARFSTSIAVPDNEWHERLCLYIDEQSLKQIGDAEGAHCDARAWLATAKFLLHGVLNLVSQRDANVTIGLSKDSKRIAEASRRDSTSMRAIAILTMFFLPGTFTAVRSHVPFSFLLFYHIYLYSKRPAALSSVQSSCKRCLAPQINHLMSCSSIAHAPTLYY